MNNKAISIIETVFVVICIGVLASLVIPKFQKMADRTEGAEAVHNIRRIHAAQQSYFNENGIFFNIDVGSNASDWDTLDLNNLNSGKFLYDVIVGATPDTIDNIKAYRMVGGDWTYKITFYVEDATSTYNFGEIIWQWQ